MNFSELVFSAHLQALNDALSANPALANEALSLPDHTATAHPLHRICDAVSSGHYSEATGIEVAKLFLKHGADLNVVRMDGKDSPLTAACSMRCDQLALFYVQKGASIDHQGCHGGTALHWASWCGRDEVVEKLVTLQPDLNQLCIDYKSTPLFWAAHGYRFGGKENRHHQVNCARILLAHGADPSIPNLEGYRPVQLIGEENKEFLAVFQ
jgi:ankyrin repeat protein